MHEYDVVIVGGGLVGGALACALAPTGLRIALVEAVAPETMRQPSYDERVIALSLGSQRILQGIGLWPRIAAEAEPIRRVHVSDRGHCGFTRLDHAELGVEALGQVAPARVMGHAIRTRLATLNTLTTLCPARLCNHRLEGDRVTLDLHCQGRDLQLGTRLLVAADGGDSAIRARLGLGTQGHAYGQDAIITTVTADHASPGTAYERFTESGPLALLPMTEGRYSVVWTCREDETAELLALSDADFIALLQARFGHRLGRLERPSARQAYPLRLALTREPVQQRVVLIGNAAHTLHPVAGQGFNLGLRDVAALAEVLAEPAGRADPGDPETLAAYRRWRGGDQLVTGLVTDLLARVFVNPLRPVLGLRAAAMLGIDLLPGARQRVARRFMGLEGTQPRLACGLPLRTSHV
ncbi:2-octaprenyl-6-methoxyphenyl hydroxylase [Marichromatium sp. AB32]|uniref:2-octaprenyl-6-methoxyphenyl hydroxylase n=1 Tax=Marichromatium sp. AB32 TaxID=2483363 RepID=UPI000F3FD569|nr:2-octaprenyl-6-methoxyphenyl hydroxylase [Marichromatium sp. AB32]RNE93968.1 2-octaprenyl-6-methoxyphenyl hydroxylase [Marichromatium sp. AB32]